jgi:signal transduction histidine kinase
VPRLLPRSLIGRVFALYSVTLMLFIGVGVGLFYREQFNVELEEAQLRAEALAAVITPTVTDSAVIGDYDTIRRTLERAVHHSSFSSASFIDLRGGVVRAPRSDAPAVTPPQWLVGAVSARLYDNNHPINVGGRDYGVLRLSFAPERIASGLWQQTRMALALALAGLVGGLVVIRFPLVRWLGRLDRVDVFEAAMQSGQATPAMLGAEEAPAEFRKTFEVLGRAAASLQAQRAQAAVTLSAIADGVFTLDDKGHIVLANPAACAMVEQDLQSLLGQPLRGVLPLVHADAQTLAPWSAQRVTLSPGAGREVVLDTTLSPILEAGGTTAGWVLACRDISEQHGLDQRLRTELRSREAALVSLRQVLEGLTHEATGPRVDSGSDDLAAISAMISDLVSRLQVRGEQLDAIFALSPDGFVSFDRERRANYVSPAFTQLTGLFPARVLGLQEQELEALVRAQCAPHAPWRGFDALRRDLRLRGADSTARREVFELQRPRKRVLQVGLREGTTEVISQVLSLRDITHESEVDQMKSEFLSTAAHELRTPMASIYGFVELLMMRQATPQRQSEMLAKIHRQATLMIHIINELLDLARIEARRGKDFVLETVEVDQLVADVLRDFKPPQERATPACTSLVAGQRVCVDRYKLHQALNNVLSNAYKYSPGGGAVAVRLCTGEDATAQLVGIEVSDRGIGMTPEQLSRVSERFYRADASGNIPGTGLGMSIVKEIIELLGGRMALASTAGEGTQVTLWLPTVAADATAPQQAEALA